MTNKAGLSVACDLGELLRYDRLIASNLLDPAVASERPVASNLLGSSVV
ncbi:MAG: hypothetical protein ABJN35_14420 [Erythrobacter sp.]